MQFLFQYDIEIYVCNVLDSNTFKNISHKQNFINFPENIQQYTYTAFHNIGSVLSAI